MRDNTTKLNPEEGNIKHLPKGAAIVGVPDTWLRKMTVTTPGNIPPARVRSATLILNAVQLQASGILTVMLGSVAVPFYVPSPEGLSQSIHLYRCSDNEMLVLSEVTLSQPLVAGNVALLTVE